MIDAEEILAPVAMHFVSGKREIELPIRLESKRTRLEFMVTFLEAHGLKIRDYRWYNAGMWLPWEVRESLDGSEDAQDIVALRFENGLAYYEPDFVKTGEIKCWWEFPT